MPAERLEESKQRLAGMSVDAFVGVGTGLFSWEGTEQRAAQIRVPTLVVYGDLDAPALIAGAQQLAAAIPGAVTEVTAESGHSPQWERPELFNVALRRFIDAHAASTQARPLASGRG
jgi:pimeloyl-ACP methyl ester carboxylesterase